MKNDKTDFTQGSILKKLALFMLPILGALVLQAAYGAVDLLVVGRFGSTSGLSAVSTGSQVLNLVTFVVTQLAMGVTVLIARYLGEKKHEFISPVIGGAAVVFALLAAVLFGVLVFLARPISSLMQAPAEALDLTTSYVRICGAGIFFIVAYNMLSALFRGLGDSRSPLIFVLVACVVNIIGDLVLVAGFHLDAVGAAIATVAAQAVSVVCAVVMLLKKDLPFSIRKADFRLNFQCKKFLAIGLPLALQEFLTQLSFLALCAFVNRLGLEASSGYGVACKIVNFAMLIPSALMQSMASFISQNIGAGKHQRARQTLRTGIGIGLFFGLFVFALVLCKGDLLCSFFTTDAPVIANGYAYLKGFALETILTAILFSMIGYFNGSGKTVLLKLICGFMKPDSGTVTVNGKVIGKDADFPENTGIIIEAPGFLPNYSGMKNLEYLASIRGKIGKEQIESAMKTVGLDPSSKLRVGKYSLGMKPRLGIAQAIMEDQQLLILDEPMNALDKDAVEEMRKLFLSFKASGKTMLIVSHNEGDISTLCDEVYEFDGARIKRRENV